VELSGGAALRGQHAGKFSPAATPPAFAPCRRRPTTILCDCARPQAVCLRLTPCYHVPCRPLFCPIRLHLARRSRRTPRWWHCISLQPRSAPQGLARARQSAALLRLRPRPHPLSVKPWYRQLRRSAMTLNPLVRLLPCRPALHVCVRARTLQARACMRVSAWPILPCRAFVSIAVHGILPHGLLPPCCCCCMHAHAACGAQGWLLRLCGCVV
jgi:hypothetical protein